jgi:hypothetical protein
MKYNTKYSGLVIMMLFVLIIGAAATAQAQGNPRLRLAHASPDAPAADIYLDNDLFFPNVPFANVTAYHALSVGDHRVRVFIAGTPPQNQAIIDHPFGFGANQDYTMVAMGQVGGIVLQLFPDDNRTPDAGRAKIRIIHAAPKLQTVNVCLVELNQCVVNDLAFTKASGYTAVTAGSYNVQLRRPGTNDVLLASSLRFEDRFVYTLFVMGISQTEQGLKIVPGVDASPPPVLPPDTGALLSPMALFIVVITMVSLIIVGVGGVWAWRRSRTKSYR